MRKQRQIWREHEYRKVNSPIQESNLGTPDHCHSTQICIIICLLMLMFLDSLQNHFDSYKECKNTGLQM